MGFGVIAVMNTVIIVLIALFMILGFRKRNRVGIQLLNSSLFVSAYENLKNLGNITPANMSKWYGLFDLMVAYITLRPDYRTLNRRLEILRIAAGKSNIVLPFIKVAGNGVWSNYMTVYIGYTLEYQVKLDGSPSGITLVTQ